MNGQVSTLNMPVLTGYGIFDREFRKKVGMTAPNFSDFSVFRHLKLVNKLKPNEQTKRHEFYHYEKTDHLKANATIVAVNTGVANQVTITLAAEDHYDTGTKSYPIVTNDVVFSNQITGLVFSVDRSVAGAHTVTIKSVTGTNDVQTAAVIGSTVLFAGNSQQEASGATEMRVPSFNKITQNIKTTRGHFRYTDHAGQNIVELTGPDGSNYIHPMGISDTAQQFEMDEEYAMLTNRKNTATVTNAAGNSINTTQGLIPEIYANGMIGEYFGEADMSSFQDWLKQVNANYGDGEYLCLSGLDLGLNILNWSIDFSKNDAASTWFGKDGKEVAATFGFKQIQFPGLGFTVNFKDLKAFSHSGTMGSEGLPYSKMGLMIPCGEGLNPMTNEMMPYLQIRYAAPGGAPSEIQGDIKVFYTGGNARSGATNDILEEGYHMVSYKAMQYFNMKKFMVIERAGW